jgi:hypothetical protein
MPPRQGSAIHKQVRPNDGIGRTHRCAPTATPAIIEIIEIIQIIVQTTPRRVAVTPAALPVNNAGFQPGEKAEVKKTMTRRRREASRLYGQGRKNAKNQTNQGIIEKNILYPK